MLIGNPAEPALMERGIWSKSSWFSFRLGYLGDWVYKQRFEQEFLIGEESHTKNQLTTHAGIATFNFSKRLDLYAILGASRMQVDDQIYSSTAFSWCVGGKVVFLKHKNLFFGADMKFFKTDQKPNYLLIEGLPYNIVNYYRSKYYDLQGAIGVSYRLSLFAPFINATYIDTHISQDPGIITVRFPDEDELGDVPIPSMISRKKWGMSLGFSLIDISKATLAFEWRLINQNGVNVNGEIRF